ncbi:unnamed protein product [Torque teno mini virus 4]|uniref:Capsid protein n=1 Tax=Torque teno mini virus 4 TaxID=687372 RepID=Q9DUB1_9VIRU|nr:hypothetical protein TTMV4_gp2 [Torque teno mini virus 4]BAB19326.1 unnamed protein product [Torque teno mini virus 4]
MPYYYRRNWRLPYRRRRWFWRRRPRPFIRRRFHRRRVRRQPYFHKKLKKLKLQQYQPRTVRYCKIKGFQCLFEASKYRIGNNYTMYFNTFAPEHLPGGGGFSIVKYSLESLYSEHEYVRNWWTKSNLNLPLFRYLGCTLKLYQSEDVDYAFQYQNCYPMVATAHLYISRQPSIMMMNNHSILVPSKRTQKRKKPCIKIKVSPPSQMENKWYFQKDNCKTPLLITTATACSFDHYYLNTSAKNNCITIYSLNTYLYQSRHFNNRGTTGYHPKNNTYLYGTLENGPKYKVGDLIYLGNTMTYQQGQSPRELHPTDTTKGFQEAKQFENWGNPFYTHNLHGTIHILQTTESPTQMYTGTSYEAEKTNLTEISNNFYTLRYNPYRDSGEGNKIYLLKNWTEETGWDPPTDTDLIMEGYPLWLMLWGWIDWQKKLAKINTIDTKYILVIQTKFTKGEMPIIVPIDYDFIDGQSPYTEELDPTDKQNWHPMVQYQQQTINNILTCGPGTPKYNGKNTVEAKLEYSFKFKFGGCPPPMAALEDPCKQPTYQIPQTTTMLQDPTTPLQYYLWNFDERRGQLTKTAADRIQKDWQLTDSVISTTGLHAKDLEPLQTHQEIQDQTSSEEESEEDIFSQLQRQRAKQHRIRQRILQLVTKIQKLE